MNDNKKIIIIGSICAALLAVIILFGTAGYFSSYRSAESPPAAGSTGGADARTKSPAADNEIPFFSGIFDTPTPSSDSNGISVVGIIARLCLAVILAAILAFRPRKNVPLFRRNLYVAQTQILLAVVAAALMMIVGDNAARAFAIFAAVSLVRFRTNIRDPKEITVLLISLALGLAAGVGRWELGIALCLFALALLQLLEYKEPENVYRSMELTVKTRDTDITQKLLKGIFDRHKLDAEVRQLNPPDGENPVGCIMYYTNLRLNLSTDYLSDLIMSSDAESIESIEWKQKKDAAYIYQ